MEGSLLSEIIAYEQQIETEIESRKRSIRERLGAQQEDLEERYTRLLKRIHHNYEQTFQRELEKTRKKINQQTDNIVDGLQAEASVPEDKLADILKSLLEKELRGNDDDHQNV